MFEVKLLRAGIAGALMMAAPVMAADALPTDGLAPQALADTAQGLGGLGQGFLEQSNVNIVEEMVNLIISQRAYESNSRVVRAADEMYQNVNNMTR